LALFSGLIPFGLDRELLKALAPTTDCVPQRPCQLRPGRGYPGGD